MIPLLLAMVLACGIGALPSSVRAQGERLPRVGVLFLDAATRDSESGGLTLGLRELGYVRGHNVVVESRYADGRPALLAALAAELVAAKVDVIVAGGPGPLAAARRATSLVPIVAVSGSDPVAEGWAATLARPGGNVTGLAVTFPQLDLKRLELLKEVLPPAARVAVVIAPSELRADGADVIADMEAAAQRLGLRLQIQKVRGDADIQRVARVASEWRAQAIMTVETTFVVTNRARIAEMAAREGIPVAGEFTIFGADDILMAYGADLNDLLRRAATYVDKILKGARPGDLPIERPTKFDLTLNLKVARSLNVVIPPSIRLRADRVIE